MAKIRTLANIYISSFMIMKVEDLELEQYSYLVCAFLHGKFTMRATKHARPNH